MDWNKLEQLFLQLYTPNHNQALNQILQLIHNWELPPPPSLSLPTSYLLEYKKDIQQQLCLKILENQIPYQPQRGPLKSLLLTIIRNLWIDLVRSLQSKKIHPDSHEILTTLLTSTHNPHPPYLPLKKEYQIQIQLLNTKERLFLKLAFPYLFQYKLQPDERSLLPPTFPSSPEEQKIYLQQTFLEEALEKGKIRTPSQTLQKWLNLPSIAAVDTYLYRLKQKLPWLNHLSKAIAPHLS